MASKRKKSLLIKNKFIALLIVLTVAVIASMFFALQNSTKLIEKLTGKSTKSQISQNKDENVIDCSRKLPQKDSAELEEMLAQGKNSKTDCLHIGCGNFF